MNFYPLLRLVGQPLLVTHIIQSKLPTELLIR